MAVGDLNQDGRIDWHDRYRQLLNPLEVAAEQISNVIFTVPSAILHTVVFGYWLVTHGAGIDHAGYPIGTLALSLEAIYITLFIGIGQVRGAKASRVAQEQRDHMQQSIERLLEVNTALTSEIHEHVLDDPAGGTSPA